MSDNKKIDKIIKLCNDIISVELDKKANTHHNGCVDLANSILYILKKGSK